MDILAKVLDYIALGIGIIALLVIVWGVIRGVIGTVRAGTSRQQEGDRFLLMGHARYDIGYHLLLGLEFLVAADIIRTIIDPTLPHLAILGSIVVIRVVIGYFLDKEIQEYHKHKEQT